MEYFEAALDLLRRHCNGGVGVVGFSKGGDLALALAVTQGSNVSLKPVKALICANFLSGRSSSLDKWVFGKRWGGNHKRGLKSILMGESVTFLKPPQGQTLFPAIGLRSDFKPKLREDGTLNCFGALEES